MFTTTNMTVSLADLGVAGTNSQGRPYYAFYTTNFPNAAWYLSYGGGALPPKTNNAGQWDGTTVSGVGQNGGRPAASSTNAIWFGSEWTPFELTLSGNAADKCDTTYINEFSIPMVVRALTNSPANAQLGIFPSNSLAFYQVGGWTNWTNPAAVAATLSNLVQQMTNTFPNAVITNSSGIPVMVAGPSSAAAGTLVAPQFTNPPFVSDVQNSFPTLGAYFAAVKNAQPGRKAKIKDFIGQSGGSNKPTYFFYYDFDLTVTASNSLRLEGSLFVTNAPASLGTFWTNATNLVLEIGADAGPNDSWASSAVYLAPTPANYVSVAVSNNLTNGALTGYLTNVLAYSGYASNGLAGQNVSITGTNLLGTVQVAFSGASNTLVPSPFIVSTNMTNISAVVPFAAVNGPIVVTTTNGSGKSANNFFVTGATNADGYTNAVPGGSNAPVITGFSPTNGKTATAVFAIEGDWLAIATNSETGPTNANPTLPDLYQSSFGTSIMGRIMGDLAAGFALGFINSINTNPYYTTNATNALFGDSPSGSWWGGNEYPAGGSNSMSYSQVNTSPQLSQWGSLIQTATAVTYGHPIYDRMQYFAGTNPLQIQPASATNNIPNIWVVEIEIFNGMASVGSNAPSSVLTYNNWLTNYPSLTNTNRTADPDGDGFDNNEEYAFGGNPTVGTPALLAMSAANVSFIALNNATTNYTVQNTTNLSTGPWTNFTLMISNSTNQLGIPLPAYYQRQEFTVPLSPGTNNFYRVIFTNQ